MLHQEMKYTMGKTLSQLPEETKCTRCRSQATIRMTNHHANFCPPCFTHFVHSAVERAWKKFPISRDEPLMVAVSGGKDSLALWDILNQLGHKTKGLHINLGIEGFSNASVQAIERFAAERRLPWAQYSLEEVFGHTIPEIQSRTRRKICGVCGLLKRRFLNRLTLMEGFQVLSVGHNLDDEAGRLLGNMVRHREQYMENLYPYLPSPHPRMPARVKPLYRLDAYEITTYCGVRHISFLDSKCPMSRGATSHSFKEALRFLEEKMPGTKRHFLFKHLRGKKVPGNGQDFGICRECSEPTFGDHCSVCALRAHVNQPRKKVAH